MRSRVTLFGLAFALGAAVHGQSTARLELRKGDRVVFVGNTMAERMQLHNHFEARLVSELPTFDLVVHNLGWSADTITLQPRPLNFGSAEQHLVHERADVIFAFFGSNESFDGEAGLPGFTAELTAYLRAHLARRYNGRTAPRLALVSPIAQQRIARLEGHIDVEGRNALLSRYVEAMRRVSAELQVPFIDVFTPTRRLPADEAATLTINGIHLSEQGDRLVADLMMRALGYPATPTTGRPSAGFEALRDMIREKNQQFFYRWRPVNAEYVVGRRVEPFGSVNFPPEMRELDRMVVDREAGIWAMTKELNGSGGAR